MYETVTMKVGLLKSDPGTLFSEGVAQYAQQEKGGEGRGLTTQRLYPGLHGLASLSVSCLSWVPGMPVTPALRRLRQCDCCKCKDMGPMRAAKPKRRRGQ